MEDLALSRQIEEKLVELNPRHMKSMSMILEPGYCLRAANLLGDAKGNIIIGTGFPVAGTFETDGPVGAMVLYRALEEMGCTPWIAGEPILKTALEQDYRTIELTIDDAQNAEASANEILAKLKPNLVLSIERPGRTKDGNYYNMRSEKINSEVAVFDPFIELCKCPTIGIGDGGNEIGMGNLYSSLKDLQIKASITKCDELVVSDVSNWAAYGILAMLNLRLELDLTKEISHREQIDYLVRKGACDGVSRKPIATEDGFDPDVGSQLISEMNLLVEQHKNRKLV